MSASSKRSRDQVAVEARLLFCSPSVTTDVAATRISEHHQPRQSKHHCSDQHDKSSCGATIKDVREQLDDEESTPDIPPSCTVARPVGPRSPLLESNRRSHPVVYTARKETERALASKLTDYLEPGGTLRYQPRPEWYRSPSVDLHAAHAAQHRLTSVADSPSTSRDRSSTTGPLSLYLPVSGGPSLSPNDALVDRAMDAEVASPLDAHPVPAEAPHNMHPTVSGAFIPKAVVFGKEWDSALHVAIRRNVTEAVWDLLRYGAAVDLANAKGVTPLMLASQKGNLPVVQALVQGGASPSATSLNGTSPVLQAAHFGHEKVVAYLLQVGGQSLVEMSNLNRTTPLMRAAQEGHYAVVNLLVHNCGADVNRRNRVQTTALMLAAQRGHAEICQTLIDAGADLNAVTNQDSTALLLSCKRNKLQAVQTLVAAGCELYIKDAKGHTARDVAIRRKSKDLVNILDSTVQVYLMQSQEHTRRRYEMMKIWHLLQQDRASVKMEKDVEVSIHGIGLVLETGEIPYILRGSSTQALVRTMQLPAPLVSCIAEFLPLPPLWQKRMGMLTKRASVHADAAVTDALDMMDEILEVGGLVEACDAARIPPPPNFVSWRRWKAFGLQHGTVSTELKTHRSRPNIATAQTPSPQNPKAPSFLELRRQVGYLQILANHASTITPVLLKAPYRMSKTLLQQLVTCSDAASVVRRTGCRGVHFDASVAFDFMMLISELCSWYWRERDT
jgi:ankyrin repeat protein